MTLTTGAREPVTAADLLARARELAPTLRERAADIEQHRKLPADVVELLRGTGVFRMCWGREWGGLELTSVEQTEVVEALAYGDASAAWCAVIGANTGIYANFIDQATAKDMFAGPDTITAGLLQPSGRAERVPGGYRLTGRWPFGSGIDHADWVTSGAFVFQDGEPYASPDGSNPHESRQFMVPRSQVELIDNWHTTGLCGSGSCDYTITDVFVPEEHTYTFGVVHGRPSPLAQPDAFTRAMCGVPLGVARAALDHARELATGRIDRMTGTAWADSFRAQTTLALCEADFNAARAGVYGSMTRQWEVLAAGGTLDDLTPDERAASPLAWLHAFRMSRSIVNRLYDLLQTWSINKSSPMDRWLRDTTTMCQHLIAQDRILQSAGAYLVGGRPEFGISLGIV
ncbi:acyl-CoA dehydrogenase family protein [Actinacidiphila epipremni]|jgi:alkylation response protein AidB-like acyl-CoA dehydrogenase|uniref:Acyl-CoA dehydrogenase n=1 Tax=Actinacidiphila epipremni TaxID=2053013 RepID=A0ABX0ZFU6_9ACTN|nr:acyl-CoA dehydrogenase family protein [Actinacidiphila epipremni]NJP42665.1 acyl-CoA dehydrogenase [Actinacidiphila epipremni]